MDPGTLGELCGGRRTAILQGTIEPESLPDVDGLQVERREHGAGQPAREVVATGRFAGLLVGAVDGQRHRVATASRSDSGIGRWTSTGRM